MRRRSCCRSPTLGPTSTATPNPTSPAPGWASRTDAWPAPYWTIDAVDGGDDTAPRSRGRRARVRCSSVCSTASSAAPGEARDPRRSRATRCDRARLRCRRAGGGGFGPKRRSSSSLTRRDHPSIEMVAPVRERTTRDLLVERLGCRHREIADAVPADVGMTVRALLPERRIVRLAPDRQDVGTPDRLCDPAPSSVRHRPRRSPSRRGVGVRAAEQCVRHGSWCLLGDRRRATEGCDRRGCGSGSRRSMPASR